MATSKQFQERLRRAVREVVQKCLAEGDLPEVPEGEARFTTIETIAMVGVGVHLTLGGGSGDSI
jgi:hypothetical protein